MPDATVSAWAPVLALMLVLGVILALAWVVSRLRLPGLRQAVPMRVVGAMPLGPRERLVVVEIQDRWHVLGVTAHTIQPIAEMPRGELPATASPGSAASFVAELASRMKRAS